MSFIAILPSKLNNSERAGFIVHLKKSLCTFSEGLLPEPAVNCGAAMRSASVSPYHWHPSEKCLYLHLPFVHKLKVKVFLLNIISFCFLEWLEGFEQGDLNTCFSKWANLSFLLLNTCSSNLKGYPFYHSGSMDFCHWLKWRQLVA